MNIYDRLLQLEKMVIAARLPNGSIFVSQRHYSPSFSLRTYVRNKVDIMPLACKDADGFALRYMGTSVYLHA